MSDTGKQSPLGVNSLSALLQNTGLRINPEVPNRVGTSRNASSYSFGSIVQTTCLRLLTYAINDGYVRGQPNGGTTVSNSVYDNLISIANGTNSIPVTGITSTPEEFTVTHGTGTVARFLPGTYIRLSGVTPEGYNGPWTVASSSNGSFTVIDTADRGTASINGSINYNTSIPALGNSKAPTYTWLESANTGDSTSEAAQLVTWNPYNYSKNVTQWGYVRLIALQAWNEFNWNGNTSTTYPAYKDFTQSFLTGYGFIEYSNVAINAMATSPTFLRGTFSNMNDLISADVAGVNLATREFGLDLIALGKAIDLTKLDSFGMPSVLLKTMRRYNAVTQSVSLALLASGIESNVIDGILSGATIPTIEQEQKIYGAFLIIVGVDLYDVLVPLNCKTEGLESLADLLNPKKLFPKSYQSLTVPVYNASSGPTNSKTYYPIYNSSGVNTSLKSPSVTSTVSGDTARGVVV